MVQWGIPGKPSAAAEWREKKIKDDPVVKSNERGTITFATSGTDSRTTQVSAHPRTCDHIHLPAVACHAAHRIILGSSLARFERAQVFINFVDNKNLDGMGFAPFGKVISGMDVVDSIYAGDAEKPNQGQIQNEGNTYLKKSFPRLSYISSAALVDAPKEEV